MKTPVDVINKYLENITISAWVVDKENTIIYMNSLMKDLFGDLTGQNAALIYDSDRAETHELAVDQPNKIEVVVLADVPFRRFRATADFGEDGLYTLELFEDVSEQRLAHKNMQKALAKIYNETKMAKTIQNSILPINDIYWNTIAFNSMYMPADDLGGDFYDLLKLSEDEFLIYIADVSGHGIQASLLTIFMRERVRTNIDTALTGTGQLLSKLVHDFSALGIDAAMYITMVLCKYSKSRRELSISNAGHNCFPLIVRDNGRTETIPIKGMPVCKLADGEEYNEEIISMNPGDRLILFTDGIIEEVDNATGLSFGSEGVRGLAEKHHAYSGSYLAQMIMDKSARYALINAKDDRSIIVADILS